MIPVGAWHLDNLGIAVVAFSAALGLLAAVVLGWALKRAPRRNRQV
jgi:hypothetical protein